MLHLYLLSYIVFALVLHLYLLEHDGGFMLKKLMNSMLHLYYFESFIKSMGIFLGYEFSPNMMGILEGYNKNFHVDH